ncbi:MAG: GtrA family protein [Rubritalea sp.]|jgi:putative flippase GtrA|tara:strand:+ start:7526 stop:8131 length:606 start_codon:yes stop_codon:yes gene_type:complete
MVDPYENTSESSAIDAAKTMTETKRQYKSSITVPVFGEIPLHPSEMIADLKVREHPPLWAQFFKYVVFGFLATGVLLGVYYIARTFYGDYIADDLPIETLKIHLAYVMLVGFVLANIVAYITNRMFVFTPSDRHWTVEFMIFLAVSGLSFWAGNSAKDWFIDNGLHKDVAALSFAVSSALVNFIARKYLVFDNSPKNIITD